MRLEHSLTESPLALPLSEKSDLRWSRLSAEPERLFSAVLRRMCGVGVEPPLELLPPAGVLDDSSPKKSGKSVPWSGMTPRVLSIMWSDAAPVVLSSSRVERSLKSNDCKSTLDQITCDQKCNDENFKNSYLKIESHCISLQSTHLSGENM